MKDVLKLTEIDKNDVGIAGGKGASLGEMTQAGIPVPPGFIISSDAFEKFLQISEIDKKIEALLAGVDGKDDDMVEKVSKQIEELILKSDIPDDLVNKISDEYKFLDASFVAVRSSATAEDGATCAWAGQLDSYLNTKEKDLLKNIKRCWASLFTPRAIFYRIENKLEDTKISVAVVVQKMVDSEMAGVAFSVHPVTEDRNQLIIEAVYGLGEALVSGMITPNSYVIEKDSKNIIEKNVINQKRGFYKNEVEGSSDWKDVEDGLGEKQVLSDEQIIELSNLVMDIENHYGFPCDIEWAFESGKFYIVQSRPITTLK
ncbi:MAG: PEP/pyruvate-binding domain-containing protein [Candidatus Buchananbacteria bacterium]